MTPALIHTQGKSSNAITPICWPSRRLAGCVHTWYPRPESELLWRMHDFVLLFRLHVVYMGFSMIWRRGQHTICSDQGPLCNVYIKRVSRPHATISWIRGSILFLAQ
ncbi:hypothetical protein VNO77_31479 [Canavalia gladiata]|uniref:Uncharacterized protein n=1 Tax=Canavalia gladiata TaxID=3824 RepID=A0AAN9Q3P8_CANGL